MNTDTMESLQRAHAAVVAEINGLHEILQLMEKLGVALPEAPQCGTPNRGGKSQSLLTSSPTRIEALPRKPMKAALAPQEAQGVPRPGKPWKGRPDYALAAAQFLDGRAGEPATLTMVREHLAGKMKLDRNQMYRVSTLLLRWVEEGKLVVTVPEGQRERWFARPKGWQVPAENTVTAYVPEAAVPAVPEPPKGGTSSQEKPVRAPKPRDPSTDILTSSGVPLPPPEKARPRIEVTAEKLPEPWTVPVLEGQGFSKAECYAAIANWKRAGWIATPRAGEYERTGKWGGK